MLRPLVVVAATLLSPANAEAFCSQLSGAAIVANDGTFLGTISSSFDSRSVLNEFGSHGSEFSGDSIWMRIPTKPATYSDQSPARHSDFIPASIPI